MCKCTPSIRTPFCGKLGCEWPKKKPDKILSPDDQAIRTFSILKELRAGKTLKLSIGEIAMGEDLSIGFIVINSKGEKSIGGLSTMDLKELNILLEREGIGLAIPQQLRNRVPHVSGVKSNRPSCKW